MDMYTPRLLHVLCLSFILCLHLRQTVCQKWLKNGKNSLTSKYVAPGAAVDFDCRLTDSTIKVFLFRAPHWTQPLTVKGSKLTQHGQRFIIYNFSQSDNGEYRCAYFSNGHYYRSSLGQHTALQPTVGIVAAPVVNVSDTSVSVMEHSDVTITCQASPTGTNSLKSVEWYKDLEPISPRYQLHSVNGKTHSNTLKLQDLNHSASGMYECRVLPLLPYSSLKWFWPVQTNLTVLEFRFLTTPQAFFVKQAGQSATINCTTSQPNSTTTLLMEESNQSTRTVIPDGSKITKKDHVYTITNINVQDEARYFCTATSMYGRKLTMNMGKLVLLKAGNKNPKAYLTPSKKTLLVNKSFNFTCQAFGDAISITWLRNNQAVPSSQVMSQPPLRHQGYTEFKSLLMIKMAQKAYEGRYTCRITTANQPGYINETTTQLNILECPKPDGKFADQFDDAMYIVCKNGVPTKHNCPPYGYWDDKIKDCVIPPTTSPPPYLRWLNSTDLHTKQLPRGVQYPIDCRLTDPSKSVTLLKRGVPVQVDGTKVKKDNQIFTLYDVKEDDNGIYGCRAERVKDLTRVRLYVERRMSKTVKVHLVPDSSIMEAETSLNYVIECNSRKAGKLTWYSLDPKMHAPKEIKDKIRRDSPKPFTDKLFLVLNNVTSKDAGIYMCEKRNSYGAVANKTIRVIVKDPVKPLLSVKNPVKSVLQLRSVTFTIDVVGSPTPNVTLTKQGVTKASCTGERGLYCVRQDKRVRASWSESNGRKRITVTITNVKFPNDNGDFTFLSRNFAGKHRLNVKIIVNVPLVLSKEEPLQIAHNDQSHNITCKVAAGNPDPSSFTWKYQPWPCDNVKLTECHPFKNNWKKVPLTIGQVVSSPRLSSVLMVFRTKKFGFFKCTVNNTIGQDEMVYRLLRSDERNTNLKIKEGSKLIADKGDEIKLTCVATYQYNGPPYWVDSNNKEIVNTSRVHITKTIRHMRNSTTLTISTAHVNDSGHYICMAPKVTKPEGRVAIRLKVLDVTPPTIEFNNQTVNESSHVTLNCTVSGHPTPTVTWSKDGKPLKIQLALQSVSECSSRKRDRFYHLNKQFHPGPGYPITQTMVICDSRSWHSGSYQCSAGNKAGDVSKTAYLNVLAAPKLEITSYSGKQSWVLGDDVMLTCQAKGNPTPKVRWLKQREEDGLFVPFQSTVDHNGTHLVIKDLKEEDFAVYRCEAVNKMGQMSYDFNVAPTPVINKYTSNGSDELSNPSVIAIGICSGIIVLFFLAISVVLYRRKKTYGGFYILTLPPMPDYLAKLDPLTPIQEQTNKLPLCPEWEFPRNRLTLGKIVGSGAFGQVYKADAVGIVAFDPRSSIKGKGRRRSRFGSTRSHYYGNKQVTSVACKGLKDDASESDYKDLVSELKILMHIGEHKNIVNLLGACTKGRECDLLVIIEYCPHGNLLEFLRKRRDIFKATWSPATEKPDEAFSTTDLVITAFQIARAMEFLTTRKCVHRDLAARNILVGENYVMKIADFGLARDIYKDEHYFKTTSGLLPVKWMAIEALVDRVYTHQSDVWSFGVLLWEIFTLGGNPYPGLPANEVYQYLMEGQRMNQPEDCPDEIYYLMLCCWEHEAESRPVFSSIVQTIDKLLEQKTTQTGEEYLELENEIDPRENQPYYLQPEEIHAFEPPASPLPFDSLNSPLPPLPQEEMEMQQLIKRSDSDDHNSNTREFFLKDVPKGKRKRNEQVESDNDLDQHKKSESSGIVSDDDSNDNEQDHLIRDYEGVFDPPSPYINTKGYSDCANGKTANNKPISGRKESARYV